MSFFYVVSYTILIKVYYIVKVMHIALLNLEFVVKKKKKLIKNYVGKLISLVTILLLLLLLFLLLITKYLSTFTP